MNYWAKYRCVKWMACVLFYCGCTLAVAQRSYLVGVVNDPSNSPLEEVTVRNVSAGLLTSTGLSGTFRIPAKLQDTIAFSHVGFEPISQVVDQAWIQNGTITIVLTTATTYLDEVTITRFPEYQQFKDQILSTDPEDTSFHVFGVPKVVITHEDRLNASLKIRGPISALHNTFSKRAKEQKKLREVLQYEGVRDQARQKFTRDWVAQTTRLQGDKLTSFIAFCNFSEKYIAETPEYMIHEDMMALLPTFLEAYENEG